MFKPFSMLLFLSTGIYTMQADEPPMYRKYVHEIVHSFAQEMEQEFNLRCIGSGGQMPYNVEEIEVHFVGHQQPSIEEAREIEVKGLHKLLNHINNHEAIRPYLKEYPFTIDRVDVSLSFTSTKGVWRTDGSVASVFFAKHKIFYDAAEVKIIHPIIPENFPKNEIIPESAKKDRKTQTLVPLMEETYEDAVKALEKKGPKT